MADHYLIFKEQNYFFAVDPDDFKKPFHLDQYWVSPKMLSKSLWMFEHRKVTKDRGLFLHVGALFGLTNADLSSKGIVFPYQPDDMPALGLCFSEIWMKVEKETLDKKAKETSQLFEFPLDMPQPAVRKFYAYKGKKILAVKPEHIFESFRVIDAGSVVNLREELTEFSSPIS